MTTAFGPQGPNYTLTRPPADPQASGGQDTFFKNCSAAGAKDGTFATADFFNMNLANLRYLCRTAGITLDDADDTMVYRAVQAIAEAVGGAGGNGVFYAVDTSPTPNVITIVMNGVTSYTEGMFVYVKVANTVTGASTLKVNNLAAKVAARPDATALIKGDIIASQIALFVYDGTRWQFQGLAPATGFNRKFSALKSSDQALSQGVQTDVSWAAATCAFGTFDGVTFTFTQAGTYIVLAGLWIGAITSGVDYIHTGGNFIRNNGAVSMHGFGDMQSWATGTGGGTLTNFGQNVSDFAVGDTVKIQGSAAANTYWTSGSIRSGGQTFFDIARLGA